MVEYIAQQQTASCVDSTGYHGFHSLEISIKDSGVYSAFSHHSAVYLILCPLKSNSFLSFYFLFIFFQMYTMSFFNKVMSSFFDLNTTSAGFQLPLSDVCFQSLFAN